LVGVLKNRRGYLRGYRCRRGYRVGDSGSVLDGRQVTAPRCPQPPVLDVGVGSSSTKPPPLRPGPFASRSGGHLIEVRSLPRKPLGQPVPACSRWCSMATVAHRLFGRFCRLRT